MTRLRIKSMHLENFKGIRDKEFVFSGKTSEIKGKNASGKTTIANAYFWLFADKDIELNSNPNVKPIRSEECTPTVSIVIDVDGKEITMQVKAGEKVIYSKYAGTEVKVDGEELLIVRQSDILAVVE